MLHTNPNATPEGPTKPHRTFTANAPAISSGIRWTRATIYAPSPDQLRAALAYFTANNRPEMPTATRLERAAHMHKQFDAEARQIIFADNPDDPDK